MKHPIIAGIAAALVIIAGAALFPLRAMAAGCSGDLVTASWYGTESGNRTANGEHFDGTGMTAAHKTLAFGTRLKVSYRGRAVTVRVNDRGPFIRGRALDLSHAAARRIGLTTAGVGRVCMERQ